MTDLLERGLAWLDDQRKRHLARKVAYLRGSDQVEIDATIGRTEFEQADEYGVIHRTESRDYPLSKSGRRARDTTVLKKAVDVHSGGMAWLDNQRIALVEREYPVLDKPKARLCILDLSTQKLVETPVVAHSISVAGVSELKGGAMKDHHVRRLAPAATSNRLKMPECIVSPIADNDLAAAQDLTILDRRGNWNEVAETIGVSPVTTTQTRTPNGVNEYQAIDPDGPGPLSPLNLAHDANGNATLDPTARNLGDGQGGVPDPSGQLYEYDEENRLTA